MRPCGECWGCTKARCLETNPQGVIGNSLLRPAPIIVTDCAFDLPAQLLFKQCSP